MNSEIGDKPPITGLLAVLVLAISVAAIPMALGVIIVRLIPFIGAVRDGVNLWSLLNFVWIYAVFYVVTWALERLSKPLLSDQPVLRNVLESLAELMVLALLYMVFFASYWGALAAAIVTVGLFFLAKRIPEPADMQKEKQR